MAIHTEYSVRMNSAYPPTTRRSPSLPASARKAPRPRRLATVDHLIPVILVTRCPREAGATPASARGHCKVSYWAHRITVRHRWVTPNPRSRPDSLPDGPFHGHRGHCCGAAVAVHAACSAAAANMQPGVSGLALLPLRLSPSAPNVVWQDSQITRSKACGYRP